MRRKSTVFLLLYLLPGAALYAAQDNSTKSPWSVDLEVGIGYDSNAYLSPDNAYTDYAPTIPVAVTPVTRSGMFMPVSLDLEYDGRGSKKFGFVGSYSFDGDFYADSDTKNANEYNHKVSAGAEFLLKSKGRREDTIRVEPYYVVHDKTYFNRDTGDQMVSNLGTDLSDRYSYKLTGLMVELKRETTRIQHSIHLEMATRDYVEPTSTAFDSYDHDYFRVGGDVEFELADPTKLTVGYDYYTRDYDEWRARDLTGTSVDGTRREYVYNQVGASLRQKLNADVTLYLDYTLTDRADQYLGYSDYVKNEYGLRLIYSKNRLRLKAKASWWERDYDNAYAFDEPTQDDMNYKSAEYSLKGDYDLDEHHGVWAEAKTIDQKSTDLRYEYDRTQIMVGWRWEN
ncbi:MAG: hypothetical protein AB1450_02015 [Pseudomonadota bacterium]